MLNYWEQVLALASALHSSQYKIILDRLAFRPEYKFNRYVLHCCHFAWWICHLLIPVSVLFISDRLGEGESNEGRGREGDCLSSSTASLLSNFNFWLQNICFPLMVPLYWTFQKHISFQICNRGRLQLILLWGLPHWNYYPLILCKIYCKCFKYLLIGTNLLHIWTAISYIFYLHSIIDIQILNFNRFNRTLNAWLGLF